MGYYVNPKDGSSKERFLKNFGRPVVMLDNYPRGSSMVDPIWQEHIESSGVSYPVVWIDNGVFTSAGIAYCKGELAAFLEDGDPREKQVFMVHQSYLEEYCPRLKKEGA